MKPSALITIGVAIAAVAIAGVLANRGGSDKPKTAARPAASADGSASAPAGSLKLNLVVSPEKEKLLQPLVRSFNASQKGVFVVMQAQNSGDTENALVRGTAKPDVWSPAGSFWGRLANLQADKRYTADDNPSIVRTPLVIAMWEPMARVLGWPRKTISFDDIVRLAVARNGWASVGKPEFGHFKYVHTNPDSSTSGAEAVTGSYYAVANKREGLTEADLAKAAPRVKDLERSIVHYGDSTLFIEDQLCKGGLAYASAVAMEETTVIDFNRRRCQATKLVSLYPSEGSFVSDSPYMVLDAPWVSPAKRTAAATFQKYLAKELTAEIAGGFGFRPGDEADKPSGLVNAESGADPAQPKRTLVLPAPEVLDAVLTTWRRDRKPARVELVLDNSGSMAQENRLEQAKVGLKEFFKQVAPQDEIGLAKFSSKVAALVPPAPYRTNKAALAAAVRDIIPEDDTTVYDATLFGVDTIKRIADNEHINAVVVLTDGQDSRSVATREQVLKRLGEEGSAETGGVRVFTIAYGSDAREQELNDFAEAAGGKGFKASTDDIVQVYRSISSFF
jgi:Ca-activated chloride channel family protein